MRIPLPRRRRGYPVKGKRSRGRWKLRLIIALMIAIFAFVNFMSSGQTNPITGETQRVSLSPDQEIRLGLQAAPRLIDQYQGAVAGEDEQGRLDAIGEELVAAMKRIYRKDDAVWDFEFTLLNDAKVINAFALPGGQTFITRALYDQLTDAQLAGVMGHEIAHVIHRHGSEHMAKAELTKGLTQAAVVAADNPNAAQMAQVIGSMINMKYGRDDELECDMEGLLLMAEAGYDPRAMIEVMEILAAAGGGGQQPEFFSTHPNPENRIGRIKAAIERMYPNGVPGSLKR